MITPRRRTSSSPTAAARSTSSSTTSATRTPGRSRLPSATDDLRQHRVLPGRHPRRAPKRIARLAKRDGDPLAGLEQLRDDPRRSEGRRHAARHGARLRDVRHRRPAGLQPACSGRRNKGPTGIAEIQCPTSSLQRQARHHRQAARTSGSSRRPSPQTVHDMLTRRRPVRHRHARRRSPASTSPARPARRPTTATPGSSAGRRS